MGNELAVSVLDLVGMRASESAGSAIARSVNLAQRTWSSGDTTEESLHLRPHVTVAPAAQENRADQLQSLAEGKFMANLKGLASTS
jgi:hypothetical protein